MRYSHPYSCRGFTLVEIAMVLMIIGLLLGGLIPTLSTQMESQHRNETRKQLDEIQQAMIGFAIVYGRLPCPSSTGSNGMESFCTTDTYPCTGSATSVVQSHGRCTNPYNGFLPAATLGVTSVADSQGITGFAVDSWGNRIRYAVTSANSNAFTKTNGMSTVGISSLSPNLLVCSTASTSSTSCSVANTSLTSSPGVPALIYSTGKNGGYGGNGLDEAENPNPNSADNDRVFAFHAPSPSTATNGEFDDLMLWVSPNILFNRMVAAGKLP